MSAPFAIGSQINQRPPTLRCAASPLCYPGPSRAAGAKTIPCEHVPKLRGGDPYEAWPMDLVQVAEAELVAIFGGRLASRSTQVSVRKTASSCGGMRFRTV